VTWIASNWLPGNLVLGTSLTDDDIEHRIDIVLDRIGQTSDQLDWFVFPSCQPDDLGERLITQGNAGGLDGTWELFGQIGGPGGTWMIAELDALASPTVSTYFHVEPVVDEPMVQAWKLINTQGFGGGDYQVFFDAFARHGFDENAVARQLHRLYG
jgi:hypothetical protein